MNNSLTDCLAEAINIQQQRQDKDFQEMMSKPLHERVAKGHTLANLTVDFSFYDGTPNQYCPYIPSNEGFIESAIVHSENNISRFREGTPVILSNGNLSFHMTIDEDQINDMTLVSGDFDVKNNHLDIYSHPRNGWQLDEVNLNINQRLLMAARDRIAGNGELSNRMESLLNGSYFNHYLDSTILPTGNSSQDEAVSKALGCSYFHLIQGPPGTGKTYTIARIVNQLVRQNKKVLVTGVTHTAINNALNAISNRVGGQTDIIKIGEKAQATEVLSNPLIVRKTRLPYAVYISNISATGSSNKGVVIGATPYSLCYPASKKLQGWDFDYVIIDEASQMSMPLALAAISYGTKLVLVGDHKQLDPIMPSNTGNWLFSKSIFKHLVDLYPAKVTMLDQSYRLSPSLVRIPTKLFYAGKLRSALQNDSKEFTHFECKYEECSDLLNNAANETLFIHHEFDSLGRSPYEAKLVANLVSDLIRNGVDLSEIALISPYRTQIREMKRALHDMKVIPDDSFEDIFIDTIERMQGQERDYVIFSLSNSNPLEVEDRLDFFFSANRLNVAITRAKTKCITIANEKIFSICKDMLGKVDGPLKKGIEAYLDFYKMSTKVNARVEEEEW